MSDLDDYSNDGEDFNDLHSESSYYLYPNLFTNPRNTRDLHVTTFAWLELDMVCKMIMG